MQQYDYFKVFGGFTHVFDMFHERYDNDRRFVFILDVGELCEEAHFAGFSTIFISNETELLTVARTIQAIPMASSNCIIFPCCQKAVNDCIINVTDDKSRVVKNAWRMLYHDNKTRQFYLCNKQDFVEALKETAGRFKSEVMTDKIKLQYFSDIQEGQTDWLWHPYIPKGCITILYAAPGTGKTFFTCWLAGVLSRGDALPDAVPEQWLEPEKGITMFFNAEDPADKTLKPRLLGCNADMKNIVTAENWDSREFVPYTFDDPRLDTIFAEVRPSLVIFDPIQSYIGSNVDMNRANQTRPLLAGLAALANKYGFALLIVCHINKMSGQDIGDRIIGSQDIKGAARSVLFLGQHPDKADVKVLFQIKNNLEEWGAPIAFQISNDSGVPAFEPCNIDTSALTPERCTGSTAGRARAHGDSMKKAAEAVIEELFKEREKINTSELKEIAAENDISWRVFQKELSKRAKWHRMGFGNENIDYYKKIR